MHGQQIDEEPPKKIKIIIGIAVSIVAYLLVISGGVNAVKGLLNVGGLLTVSYTHLLILERKKSMIP